MNKNKFIILTVFVLLLLTTIFYGRTLFTWFQQDEWDWMGRYTYYNSISHFPLWEAFKSSLFPHPRYRFTPLYDALYAGATQIFGLEFIGYALFGLFCHIINSILVYVLTQKITRNHYIAFLSSILFATSSIGQKSVTWTATSFNTEPAFTFSMLSIIAVVKYFTEKNRNITQIFFYIFIALWFKETALGVVLALPVIAFILENKSHRIKTKKIFLATFVFLLIYFSTRYLLSRIGLRIHTEGYPDYGRLLSLGEYLKAGIWTPLRSFVDVFFFPNTLISIATFFRGKHDIFAETVGVNYVTLIIFPLLSFFLFSVYKKFVPRKTAIKKVTLIGLTLVGVSIITYFLLTIRGSESIIYILRSRDLYISTAGASILLAIPVYYLLTKTKKYYKFLGIFFLLIYLCYHYININNFILTEEISRGTVRKPIIETIYLKYPQVGQKSIFYIKSDTAYYGNSNPSLPYQTGFGRTLLVWYLIKNKSFTPALAKDDYLYPAFSEGYREINGSGFGFFTNYEKLTQAVKDYSIPTENIYAFSYHGKNNLLEDVSIEVRKNLLESVKSRRK